MVGSTLTFGRLLEEACRLRRSALALMIGLMWTLPAAANNPPYAGCERTATKCWNAFAESDAFPSCHLDNYTDNPPGSVPNLRATVTVTPLGLCKVVTRCRKAIGTSLIGAQTSYTGKLWEFKELEICSANRQLCMNVVLKDGGASAGC